MIKKVYKLKFIVSIIGDLPNFLTPIYEHMGELYRSIVDAENVIVKFVKIKAPLDDYKTKIEMRDMIIIKGTRQQALYAYAISNVNYFCGEYREVKAYIEGRLLLKPLIHDEKALFQLKELYYFVDNIKEWGDVLNKIDSIKFKKFARWIRYERQNVFETLHKDICREDRRTYYKTPKEITVFGGNPLVGEVEISGSNETALAILAASMLCKENIVLTNTPCTNDVLTFLKIINGIGGEAYFLGKNAVSINCKNMTCNDLNRIKVEKRNIRCYLFSALYARFKDKKFIDARLNPEIHNALTSAIEISSQTNDKQIRRIVLNDPSVTLTIQLLIVGAANHSKTELFNVSRDPCVVALAEFFNATGIRVKGAGTDKIEVFGGNKFKATVYENIPDYIEASVFICASIVTKGYVKIKNIIPYHLRAVLNKCEEAGAEITVLDNAIVVKMDGRPKSMRVDFCPYPCLSDYYTPLFLAILGLASGSSLVRNNTFQDYFSVLSSLRYMGVDVSYGADTGRYDAVIYGIEQYLNSNDTLYVEGAINGIALLLIALSINGKSFMCNCKDLDSVFSRIIHKLNSIGAMITSGIDKTKDLPSSAIEEVKRKYS